MLNCGFMYYALAMKITAREELPMRVFKFSVTYLMWLFAALLIDHYVEFSAARGFSGLGFRGGNAAGLRFSPTLSEPHVQRPLLTQPQPLLVLFKKQRRLLVRAARGRVDMRGVGWRPGA